VLIPQSGISKFQFKDEQVLVPLCQLSVTGGEDMRADGEQDLHHEDGARIFRGLYILRASISHRSLLPASWQSGGANSAKVRPTITMMLPAWLCIAVTDTRGHPTSPAHPRQSLSGNFLHVGTASRRSTTGKSGIAYPGKGSSLVDANIGPPRRLTPNGKARIPPLPSSTNDR
jgi:hypothetical protein